MTGFEQLLQWVANYGVAIILALYFAYYITKDCKEENKEIIEKIEQLIKQHQQLNQDIKILIEKTTTLIDIALRTLNNKDKSSK